MHCSPLYLMEASLSQVLYYWYANTEEQIQKMLLLKALKLNRHKMTCSRASLLLLIYIKTFMLLKFLNLDLNRAWGRNAYSLTHLVMEYMTEVAMMHLPPINHCQSFLQQDMESKKYSNLNNGGKTNTQANFSTTFASTAKFVNKKDWRPSENTPLKLQLCFPQWSLLTFISSYWSRESPQISLHFR